MSTTIQHTVSFRYKSSASADEISKASKAFYHLKETCVREVDSKPLISRISGGKQTSPEGLDQGMNHVYLLTFTTPEDLTYYITRCPAHAAFKELVEPLIESVIVLDFEEGIF